MKCLLFGASSTAPSNSAVNYNAVDATDATAWNATEANRSGTLISIPVTLSNFYVQLGTAPGAGTQYVFTVRKNGVDTALTVTVSGTNTNATDSTHTLDLVPGDILTISCTPTGTPATSANMYWNLQVSTTGVHALLTGGVASNLSTSATQYFRVHGFQSGSTNLSTTEAAQQTIVPCAGTLQNLYVKLSGTPGTAKSYDITLVKNGTPTTLTVNVAGSATTGQDLSHQISVSPGDTLSVSSTPNGTPSARFPIISLDFVPTTNGQSFFGYGSASVDSTTATHYEQPLGNGAAGWGTSETIKQIVPGVCTLQALYIAIGTAPGTGKSRTYTIRKNAGATALTKAISDTNTSGNLTGQSVSTVQGDLLAIQAVPAGTPTANTGVHVGVLVYIAPTASAHKGFSSFF